MQNPDRRIESLPKPTIPSTETVRLGVRISHSHSHRGLSHRSMEPRWRQPVSAGAQVPDTSNHAHSPAAVAIPGKSNGIGIGKRKGEMRHFHDWPSHEVEADRETGLQGRRNGASSPLLLDFRLIQVEPSNTRSRVLNHPHPLDVS